MGMLLPYRLLFAFSLLAFASHLGLADITVNFFADAGKRPHRADGQPLEDGQIVQVGAFVDTFDPYASHLTLVDLLSNWRPFGQTFTMTSEIAEIGPTGSFYGTATGSAIGFSDQPAYLFF